MLEHLIAVRAQAQIWILRAIPFGCRIRYLGREFSPLIGPLLAAAVHDSQVFVTEHAELPEGVGREPVVVIAVEDDGGVVIDPGLPQEPFELIPRKDVSANPVIELRGPVPAHRAGDMPLIVRARIDIHLYQGNVWIVQVTCDPVRLHQYFRTCIASHGPPSIPLSETGDDGSPEPSSRPCNSGDRTVSQCRLASGNSCPYTTSRRQRVSSRHRPASHAAAVARSSSSAWGRLLITSYRGSFLAFHAG